MLLSGIVLFISRLVKRFYSSPCSCTVLGEVVRVNNSFLPLVVSQQFSPCDVSLQKILVSWRKKKIQVFWFWLEIITSCLWKTQHEEHILLFDLNLRFILCQDGGGRTFYCLHWMVYWLHGDKHLNNILIEMKGRGDFSCPPLVGYVAQH